MDEDKPGVYIPWLKDRQEWWVKPKSGFSPKLAEALFQGLKNWLDFIGL